MKKHKLIKIIFLVLATSLFIFISIVCLMLFGEMPGYNLLLFTGWFVSLSVAGYMLNRLEQITTND